MFGDSGQGLWNETRNCQRMHSQQQSISKSGDSHGQEPPTHVQPNKEACLLYGQETIPTMRRRNACGQHCILGKVARVCQERANAGVQQPSKMSRRVRCLHALKPDVHMKVLFPGPGVVLYFGFILLMSYPAMWLTGGLIPSDAVDREKGNHTVVLGMHPSDE